MSCCVLSRPIPYCSILSLHVTLSPSQNSHLGVTNKHTQHHNLPVTTTSCTVHFVSCQVQYRCVLSRRVLSRPIVSCPVQSRPVLSCPVRSHHAQSIAEFAFRSNKHTYTTPQLNSNKNILSVSSTNELKIDQE